MRKTLLGILITVGIVALIFVAYQKKNEQGEEARGEVSEEQKPQEVVEETVKEGEKPVTLLFTGDIMLSRAVGGVIQREQDPLLPFLKIAEVTRNADITFGNLENPISERGINQGSIYSFRAEPGVIHGLAYAGFDVVSIANNHIWDYGRDALTDTRKLLQERNIAGIGAGATELEANAPHITKIGSTSFAFMAYTNLYPKNLEARGERPGISTFDPQVIKEKVRTLKEEGHIVVLSLHWGEEYKKQASKEQRALAKEFVDAGADLIIGHHPHVTQEVEQYKNGWIAFSLGNFVFDQTFSKETMQGLMFKAFIRENRVERVELEKTKINSNFQPYITKELQVGRALFNVEIAKIAKDQAQGLGGRKELKEDEGMLFTFNEPKEQVFWMKDMLIPIDIIWIREGKVVGVETGVPPEPGKSEAELTKYLSPEPVEWVLELKSGSVKKYGIAPGTPVSLENET